MGTNAKLAIPLYVGDPSEHRGCTFATGLDEDNLLDGVPSSQARIESLDPRNTYFEEKFGLPGGTPEEALPGGFVGIVGTNLTQDDDPDTDSVTGVGARVRFLLGAGDSMSYPNGPSRMLPTAITSNTFDAGTYTDVDDDPFNPGSDYMENTHVSAARSAIFTFGAAHDDFIECADGILVLVSIDTTGIFDSVAIDLYEGGVLAAAGTVIEEPRRGRIVLSAGDAPRLFAAYFNAESLSAVSATPQIKVTLDGQNSRLKALALYPTVTTGSVVGIDSYWLKALPDVTDASFGDLPAAYVGALPSRNVFYWPSSIQAGVTHWMVQIRDPFNADGYIDIGEMVAGARFEATINRDLGKLIDLKPLGTKTITLGGKHVGVAGEFIRSIHMPLSWMTPAEGAALLERILRMSTLAPVAISLHSSSASEARLLSCYGSLGVAPEYAALYGLIRGTTIVVDEEL